MRLYLDWYPCTLLANRDKSRILALLSEDATLWIVGSSTQKGTASRLSIVRFTKAVRLDSDDGSLDPILVVLTCGFAFA